MPEVITALRRHAAETPEATAVADSRGALGFGRLALEVDDLARRLAPLPDTVGLLCRASVDWVIADLAATRAGKTVVPLPEFFAADQLGHVLRDAGVGVVLVGPGLERLAAALGTTWVRPRDLPPSAAPAGSPRLRKIVYTSGSTGRPKGAVLGERQIGWSARALIEASGAGPADRYLSLLPYSLLLEQICAIHVPLLVGAPTTIAAEAFAAAANGDPAPLLATIEAVRPTATVLVPDLLAGWLQAIEASGLRPPDSLRFVAVGGAPVPAATAERAWAAGIPVHEGYGLTECCSVVAVNRPGGRVPGSVGRPLPGNRVRIEDGEIVVVGPGVMDGYLGAGPVAREWRTGDLGSLDADGNLFVHGRRDTLIVTALGRNVSPEWVETAVLADPAFARCVVVGHGRPALTAILTPAAWFADATPAMVASRLHAACAGLPDYARPRHVAVVADDELRRRGCLTANGRPIRRRFADLFIDQGVAA